MPHPISSSSSSELDFTSKHFNPMKVLYHPHPLNLPCSKAKTLDNLSKFISFLKQSADPKNAQNKNVAHIPNKHPSGKQPNSSKDTRKNLPSKIDSKTPMPFSKRAMNVMHRMICTDYQSGPISLLYRAFVTQCSVKVVVKSQTDAVVPSTYCTGIVKAFDKHLSLVLSSVTHSFLKPVYVPKISFGDLRAHKWACAICSGSSGRKRRCSKYKRMCSGFRKGDAVVKCIRVEEPIQQMFLPGNSVCSVAKLG